MRIEGLGNRIGEASARVIFGPRITGSVELVRRDMHERDFWHILVKTDEGSLKHVTLRNTGFAVTDDGLSRVEIDYKRGQRLDIRIRGTGLIQDPLGKVERDPFNLKGAST